MVPWMRLAGVGPGSRAMQPQSLTCFPRSSGPHFTKFAMLQKLYWPISLTMDPGDVPAALSASRRPQEALDACAHNRSVILVQSRSRILTIVAFNHEGAFRIDERFLVAARPSRFELTRQLVNVLRQPHQVW